MPLVKPKDKEKRDDFIERCMGDETSVTDYPKRGQRFAVCNSLYNARNKKEEYSMTDVTNMASAIKTLTDIIAKEKMPKDEEDTMKRETDKRDQFTTQEEALERAKKIGCTGTHSMMDNGKRIFMPCGTHAAYDEARKGHYGKPHDEEKPGKPKDELEQMDHYGEEHDKDKKKPKKKSHTECNDDGECVCDTEIKKVIFESEVKSDAKGVFTGYGSIFGNEDQGNDIVAKGAFTKSLNERPASKVKMLFQHKTDEPIGVFTEIYEDQKGLFVKGQLAMGTQKGRETYELLKMGALDGMSIGFKADPQKQGYNENKRGVRTLKEVDLMEISLVTFPMNEEAMVQSVKGNLKSIRDWEKILRDAGGLSRTEAKIGAKALAESLNQRDADENKQLVALLHKVAGIIKQ
jgi:HK97 family phage prohead protease